MKHIRQARLRTTLVRCALSAAAAVVLVTLVGLILVMNRPRATVNSEQVARINTLIDRLTATGEHRTAYDQALTDVEASIRQLQTESPTLTSVQDQEMSKLLDALATVPAETDNYFDFDGPSPDSL